MITRQEAMLRLMQKIVLARTNTPDYTSPVYEAARKALTSGMVAPSQLHDEAVIEANSHSVNALADPVQKDYHLARYDAHIYVASLMGDIDPAS